MINIFNIGWIVFLFFTCLAAAATEIVGGSRPGSIVLQAEGGSVVYENITGNRYNIDRSLIDINGSPALQITSRDSLYFTLDVKGAEISVDCAYFDKRNHLNGARMTAGMCGLDMPLVETYDEIAYSISNAMSASIYSFDTKMLLESGTKKSYLLGRIGGVEVFDRYLSVDALERSAPQKIIKTRSGCFNFGTAIVFLVSVKNKPDLKYLDVLRSEEPMTFQRMQEQELKKIAVGRCDI